MAVPGSRKFVGITPSASQKTVAMNFPTKIWFWFFFLRVNLCNILWTDTLFLVHIDAPMFCQLSQCFEEIPHLCSYSVTKVAVQIAAVEAFISAISIEGTLMHKPDIKEHK
jgi:hypothetical protein